MEVNLMNVIQFAVLAPAQFLVAGVWQGLLLTAMAWIGLKAFPKLSPRNRFILWLNVFVLAALLPFFAAFRTPALVPLSDAAATSIRVPSSFGRLGRGLCGPMGRRFPALPRAPVLE